MYIYSDFNHVLKRDIFNQKKVKYGNISTVMILSFRTDMPGQTVQTQIRLLLQEQSDQGLHCLPFRLHRLDSLLRVIRTNVLGVRIFRKFTVFHTALLTKPRL